MKNQALFSSKNKSKKLKCRLLQFLFGALRVKMIGYIFRGSSSAISSFAFLSPHWGSAVKDRTQYWKLTVASSIHAISHTVR